MSGTQRREWAVRDNVDLWSPVGHPQSDDTLARRLLDAGLEEREVFRPGHLVGRRRRPMDSAGR